jgi:hypothetical protein
MISRSKAFLPEIHAPFQLKDGTLMDICGNYSDDRKQELIEHLSRLNYDLLPKVGLWMAFD